MNEKLSTYLNCFTKQKEAGLIIINNPGFIDEAKNQISHHGFTIANSWQEILEDFRDHHSVCIELTENLHKELYDLIAQYFVRTGAIQIMDKSSMKLESVQFDPAICHLLLITTKLNLHNIELKHSIKDKVGLIERL